MSKNESSQNKKPPFWWINQSLSQYKQFINLVSVLLAIVTIYILLKDQSEIHNGLFIIELIFLFILMLDYFWNFFKAEDHLHWFLWHIFDLLSLIPFGAMPALRLLRVVALISKTANHYLRSTRLLYVYYGIISAVIISAEIFSAIEHISFGHALYLAVVTFSTSGYGDIVPTHASTRALSMFLMILGVSMIGVIASSLGHALTYDSDDELIDKINRLEKKIDDLSKK